MVTEHDVLLTNVSKRFQDTVAVDNISLEIKHGEFFSLLGPSGCGKTTTLRMISGFEFPTSGEIQIRGKVSNNVPAYRRDTNLVFQQLALFPHLDVFDNIAFGLRLKNMSKAEIKERVERMLDVVQLKGFADRRINQISGGQQQRVAIARALVNEPAVLLLDEPLGALDLKLRLQMQIELKELQNRLGTTFVYVTHDQGEALVMSDRIAVMNNGKVEQVGGSREVYLQPETEFVASFIGETNLLKGEIKSAASNYVVDTEGLMLHVSSERSAPEGSEVSLSIRPEMIEVRKSEDGTETGRNEFRVRITDLTFHGTTVRYRVALPSGRPLDVQRLAGDALTFEAGEEVLLSIDPKSPVLILED